MTAETEKKQGGAKKPAVKKERTAVKAQLKKLKKAREEAKAGKDETLLTRIRRNYRRVTHALRRTAAPKAKAAKKE
jgi:hypothetical protein